MEDYSCFDMEAKKSKVFLPGSLSYQVSGFNLKPEKEKKANHTMAVATSK